MRERQRFRRMAMKTITFLSYPINSCGLAENIALASSFVKSGEMGCYLACANPHSLVTASKDSAFMLALQNADLLIPDGAGIVLAAKILNLPIQERIAGSDFFLALSDAAEKNRGLRYFFLGSREDVLKRICERLSREYPSVEVCGTFSPPYKEEFDDDDNKTMIDLINAAKPDVLWVGMTAPKQEKWIFKNREKLSVPFIAAIGAVFDFYAGTIKRPSPLWQRLGLEWLGRFIQEPRRLWRRNFVSMPIFLYWVLKEKLHQMFGKKPVC
jgi:N-acetylglucosaminyldiphosphoundecaprenol N-acetyl-beta-D-mannosaminyltransferase